MIDITDSIRTVLVNMTQEAVDFWCETEEIERMPKKEFIDSFDDYTEDGLVSLLAAISSSGVQIDKIEKAREGLVPKKVQVHREGKVFESIRWVRPQDFDIKQLVFYTAHGITGEATARNKFLQNIGIDKQQITRLDDLISSYVGLEESPEEEQIYSVPKAKRILGNAVKAEKGDTSVEAKDLDRKVVQTLYQYNQLVLSNLRDEDKPKFLYRGISGAQARKIIKQIEKGTSDFNFIVDSFASFSDDLGQAGEFSFADSDIGVVIQQPFEEKNILASPMSMEELGTFEREYLVLEVNKLTLNDIYITRTGFPAVKADEYFHKAKPFTVSAMMQSENETYNIISDEQKQSLELRRGLRDDSGETFIKAREDSNDLEMAAKGQKVGEKEEEDEEVWERVGSDISEFDIEKARPGLVPKRVQVHREGKIYTRIQWVRPEEVESFEGHSNIFQYRGEITPLQKRKIQKELVTKYGDNPRFKKLATGLALYTQGFYDKIREVVAAIVTDTLEEYEANAVGYFRENLLEGKSNPMMIILLGRIQDIYGHDSDKEDTPRELRVMNYEDAQDYSNEIIHALETVEPTDRPLYRGVITRERLPDFKIGEGIDLPEPTSFTRSRDIAHGFATGAASGQRRLSQKEKRHMSSLIIEVQGQNKALDIDIFSTWKQQEALSNGSFEVVGYDKDSYPKKLVLKQKEIAGSNWAKGKGIKYPVPTELAKTLTSDEYHSVLNTITFVKSFKRAWPDDKENDTVKHVLDKMGYIFENGNWRKKE